jgi:hypothetical protein
MQVLSGPGDFGPRLGGREVQEYQALQYGLLAQCLIAEEAVVFRSILRSG